MPRYRRGQILLGEISITMRIRTCALIAAFLLSTASPASTTLYNIEAKYEVQGGQGYINAYIALSDRILIYSNITLSSKGKFESIKVPLKGGSGCKNGYVTDEDLTVKRLHSISSMCVTVEREGDAAYNIKENIATKFDDDSYFKSYTAYHLFILDNACNVTMDAAWRTFRNIPDQQFVAKKLISSKCQIPGPGFFDNMK